MQRVKAPQAELEELRARSAVRFSALMGEIGRAAIDGKQDVVWSATQELADLIGATGALANLMGRRRMLLEFDAVRRHPGIRYADEPDPVTPIIPKVPFRDAIADLVSRDDRLAVSGEEVSQLYSSQRVFAMAFAARDYVTRQVHAMLSRSLERGLQRDRTIQQIAQTLMQPGAMHERIQPDDLERFALSYAHTVYRTTLATAYSAGHWRMAEDPDVIDYMPARMFQTAGDVDVSVYCKPGDGFVAGVKDRIWHKYAPPLHYQCRTSTRGVTVDECRELRLLDRQGRVKLAQYPTPRAGWEPHPRFGHGRPDLGLMPLTR